MRPHNMDAGSTSCDCARGVDCKTDYMFTLVVSYFIYHRLDAVKGLQLSGLCYSHATPTISLVLGLLPLVCLQIFI